MQISCQYEINPDQPAVTLNLFCENKKELLRQKEQVFIVMGFHYLPVMHQPRYKLPVSY